MSDTVDTATVQNEDAASATCEAGTTVGLTDAVVQARTIERDYGQGDAPCTPCAASTSTSRAARITAIMGPSGSGKSTLMHILAGLDQPTSRHGLDRRLRRSRRSRRSALTQLRRDKIGFIFQSFNLLPTLTAEENIVLPLSHRRPQGGRAWRRRVIEAVGLQRPADAQALGALRRPAAARRRRPRADHPARRRSSPTSPPATSTHAPAGGPATCSAQSRDDYRPDHHHGHPRRRARPAYADRIVFLKDGRIAHDCGPLSRDDIYDTIKALEDAAMIRIAWRSLTAHKLRTILTTSRSCSAWR